jgi:cupin 2 domain-containing protein
MNLYELPAKKSQEEIFESLVEANGLLIERIVSSGQVTPEGQWYDQERDEWVALLQGQAEIVFYDGKKRSLVSGDWLLIPAHKKHRVVKTSSDPPCIWLAVHGRLNSTS